jgi:hypothetical protein
VRPRRPSLVPRGGPRSYSYLVPSVASYAACLFRLLRGWLRWLRWLAALCCSASAPGPVDSLTLCAGAARCAGGWSWSYDDFPVRLNGRRLLSPPPLSAARAAARAGLPRLPTRLTPEPESEPAPSGAQERAAAVFRSLGLGPNGELILGGLSTARPRSAATEEAVGPPAVVYSSSIERATPATAQTYYKAVAVVRGGGGGGGGGEGGRFLSIYDGATEYRIGVDVYQPMDRNNMRETCGGFFCYTDAQQVFSAIVPSNSVLKSADRVVLKCLGWGATRRFPNGKMCVERCVIHWCPPFSHL